MNLTTFLRCLLLTLCSLGPSIAHAEDDPTYYHIEVIVFAQPDGHDAEQFNIDAEDDWLRQKTPGNYGFKPKSGLRLNSLANKLKNDGRFPILLHKAWTQAGVPRKKSPIVPIDVYGNGMEVSGAIRVHRKRYLYTHVDLNVNDNGQAFRFNQTRKMRSKKLHYLDHPRIGVLVKAYPLEPKPAT